MKVPWFFIWLHITYCNNALKYIYQVDGKLRIEKWLSVLQGHLLTQRLFCCCFIFFLLARIHSFHLITLGYYIHFLISSFTIYYLSLLPTVASPSSSLYLLSLQSKICFFSVKYLNRSNFITQRACCYDLYWYLSINKLFQFVQS